MDFQTNDVSKLIHKEFKRFRNQIKEFSFTYLIYQSGNKILVKFSPTGDINTNIREFLKYVKSSNPTSLYMASEDFKGPSVPRMNYIEIVPFLSRGAISKDDKFKNTDFSSFNSIVKDGVRILLGAYAQNDYDTNSFRPIFFSWSPNSLNIASIREEFKDVYLPFEQYLTLPNHDLEI